MPLPCAHPVLVALNGVDLTVVAEHAVRVGQLPCTKSVCAVARVDQRECCPEPLILKVREERSQLLRDEKALVDDCSG